MTSWSDWHVSLIAEMVRAVKDAGWVGSMGLREEAQARHGGDKSVYGGRSCAAILHKCQHWNNYRVSERWENWKPSFLYWFVFFCELLLWSIVCVSLNAQYLTLSGTTKTFPNFVLGWVGVKDVATAHILAYEKPEAEGRYICNERNLHNGDLVALLKELFPQYPIVAK